MDRQGGTAPNAGDFLDTYGLSLVEHVVDEWTGRTGRAVHSGDGAQISPVFLRPAQLVDWIEANRSAVEAADRSGTAPASASLVERTRAALRGQLRKLSAASGRIVERSALYRRLLEQGDPDGDGDAKEAITEEEAKMAAVALHRARVEGLLARCDVDPASLFLPVGARVRLVRDLSAPPWALEGGFHGPFPVAGTEAVVLGPAIDLNPEFPVRVAFCGEFMDADGKTRWMPDRSEPISMAVSPEDLEVVELGTYLDGTPCRSLDFVKTHFHDEDRADYGEMVVVSGGKPMRIMGFDLGKESHWISGQGWDSVGELDFLTPAERTASTAVAPAPGR